MVAPYPNVNPKFLNPITEKFVQEVIIHTVTGIRNLRGEMNISPTEPLTLLVNSKNERANQLFGKYLLYITKLSRASVDQIKVGISQPKMAARVITDLAEIYIPLDKERLEKDMDRLEKVLAKLQKELKPIEERLNNKNFITKAPKDIVTKLELQRTQLQERKKKTNADLNRRREMIS